MMLAGITIFTVLDIFQPHVGAASIPDLPHCVHDCVLAQLSTIDCAYTNVTCQCEHTEDIYERVSSCVVKNCTTEETSTGYTLLGEICAEATGKNITGTDLVGAGNMAAPSDEGSSGTATGQFSSGVTAGIVVGCVGICVALVVLGVVLVRRRRMGKEAQERRRRRGMAMRAESQELFSSAGADSGTGRGGGGGVGKNEFMHPVELDGNPRRETESPRMHRDHRMSDERWHRDRDRSYRASRYAERGGRARIDAAANAGGWPLRV